MTVVSFPNGAIEPARIERLPPKPHGARLGQLGCLTLSLNYNAPDRSGTLDVPGGQYPDMSACIRLFKRIDPNVRRIVVYSGEQLCNDYILTKDGWLSNNG